MNNLGKITSIEEVHDFQCGNFTPLNGKNGARLGVVGMMHGMFGFGEFDGYKVCTEDHEVMILISNEQNCCESWGYFDSNDDANQFIGANLHEVRLTDTALNMAALDANGLIWNGEIDLDEGSIQFVDFVTDAGVFQLAVYNAHNGYYGHSVIVAIDDNIIFDDTL